MTKKKQIQNNDPVSLESEDVGNMDQLRDILFGNQARSTERRIEELERRLDTFRRETSELLSQEVSSLSNSASSGLSKVEQEIQTQLVKQAKTQSEQHQTGFSELSENLNKVAAELRNQAQKNQRELSQRLEKMHQELVERIQTAQTESRERDDDLRQELLTLGAYLDNKKTSRMDLGQMLMDLGQQLQNSGEPVDLPENGQTN